MPGVIVYGITDPFRCEGRAPALAEGYIPRQVAQRLGEAGIFVWDYATTRWPSPSGWALRRAVEWCG